MHYIHTHCTLEFIQHPCTKFYDYRISNSRRLSPFNSLVPDTDTQIISQSDTIPHINLTYHCPRDHHHSDSRACKCAEAAKKEKKNSVTNDESSCNTTTQTHTQTHAPHKSNVRREALLIPTVQCAVRGEWYAITQTAETAQTYG